MLNNSINDLVDVLEKLSAKTQNNGGGGWNNNPFIRPGSRRRGSQRDMDRDFYYEWSQYYKAPKRNKSWRDMSDRERSEYNAEKNARKQEAQKYVRRSNEREELYRELRSSRFGSTSVGRYFQSVMERNQRIEDYGMMGKYMQANAGKIGKGLFGSGKAGAAATKAIGTFGKVISGASKILGGPFVTATLLAVDALQALGKGANQWKEATAEMYKHQTKQEQLQYELSKQQMLIENQMKIENVSAQGDIQMKMLETQGATMMEALKITTEQYAKSVDIALGPLTKGINETAYEAANARVDAVLQMQKLGLHKGQRELQYGRYREQRELQQSGKLASLEAERGVVETQYMIDSQRAAMEHTKLMESKHNLQMLVRDEHGNLLNYDAATGKLTTDNKVGGGNIAKGGQASRVITNTNEAGIGDIMNSNIVGANLQKFLRFQEGQQAKETAMGEYVWEKQREAADYQKTAVDAEYQLAQAQMDVAINVANKQLDIEVEKKEIVLDTAATIEKSWLQLAQKTESWLENFDTLTNNLGISMGYTNRGQLHGYQRTMFGVVENIAAKFGKSIEEAVKLQESFIENTGRNRLMGHGDYYGLLSLGKYLGDDGLAANYASEMEIFNAGVSDSVDMLGEALEDVNKIGLNGRKYTKTLVDNLKLAQKYQFKEGTRSLMNMARWAENTRFNIAALGGMLDKVREGGLENVITMGAQFQVLGGHAAMNADPLAMMYESFADPEAYARRMQDMTRGFGQIDKRTGETKFSGNEVMMMQQLAKVQGRSLEDVQNEVRARNKREAVARQLGGGFNEDQMAFISNNATYNKQSGRFEVKVKRGGQYVNADVGSLTSSELEQIMPADYQGKMLKNMENVVSALEGVKGEKVAQEANIAAATFEEMLNAYTERARIAHESYAEHRDKYIEETKKGMNAATSAFNDYIGIFDNGNENVDASVKKIESSTENIAIALNDTATIIAQANARILGVKKTGFTKPKTNFVEVNNEIFEEEPKDIAIVTKDGIIGTSSSGGNGIQIDTIKVEISGSLDLSSGGQSVNIINELQNNPVLRRSLTKMLSEQISSAMNGGRSTANTTIGGVY